MARITTPAPEGSPPAAGNSSAVPLNCESPPPRVTDRRFVVGALMLVMVLAAMEQTVTSTAMPTIIGDLKGLNHYSWVASLYLLACTVSMPLYGRLSDVLGRKRVIVFAIALFSASSMLAAMSHTMGQLILFRGLQGLGAGGIMPVVLTIIGDIFTLEERAGIQGFFSAVWGVSSLAGPALGAFLVLHLGWRSIFFVNLPFGVLGLMVLAWKYHDRQKPHSTDLDLAGALTLALSCTAILALVSRLGPDGWSTQTSIVLLIVSMVMMGYFIFHERRTSNPIMPPQLLIQRAIGISLVASFLLGACFLCLDIFVPLYVQGGHGGGAGAAATVVTPVMLTWALSGLVAAPLVVRWGFRKTAMLGTTLVVLGFTGLVLSAHFDSPRWVMTLTLAVTGFGFGPSSMSYLLAAQDAVEWQRRGIVTSSIALFRTIGGAMCIGLFGALFNVLIHPQVESLKSMGITPADLLDPRKSANIPSDVLSQSHAIVAGSLVWVFAAILVLAVMQMLVTLAMPSKKVTHAVHRSDAFEAMGG